ncbi:MAG: ribonuclease P protein component [Bifidobacteriaceae bacterium]|nr:ribonuclease P protein component [Bifidobacteriaceae bacterium]
MSREHKMRGSAQFRAVMGAGRRARTGTVVVYLAPTSGPVWRAGFVVSRVVGNSVERHRLTRRLRAIVAAEMTDSAIGWDIVVRALRPAGQVSFQRLAQAVRWCLVKAAT